MGSLKEIGTITEPDEVLKAIQRYKLVSIVRGINPDEILNIADSLYNGGIRLIEVTCYSEKTPSMIKSLTKHYKNKMLIGAGTVITRELVREVVDAGALYVVAPNMDESVIRESINLGVLPIPGAMTPTEILKSVNAGAKIVKLFPADALGIDYIKQIRLPLKEIPLMVTGGIDQSNARDFLKAGACSVGLGNSLVRNDLVESKDWNGLRKLAEEFVKLVM